MKKITLFIFLSFFCIAAIARIPTIDCSPTHICDRTVNYLRKNGTVAPTTNNEDCFRCFTTGGARLTCPENALVYTKSDPVNPVIHKCTHEVGGGLLTRGAWKRVTTIDFCSDSPIKNFDNVTNSQNARLTDNGTEDLTDIEYEVVENPCYMRECIANHTYNATTKSCEPDAQPATEITTTATEQELESESKSEEPVDEYKDIIKKIENEISEYSKKCSKYTKPQAE